MKKESVNTFTKGLVMDFNPLLTPNNVLTNNLNGTLITFNGNEYVLQNDFGNGEVGTAKLPAGYVPVGMKEHGGIIYVASHNPITGKSQIGSFPSPQQLYVGEDDNITNININFNSFITLNSNNIPIIEYETVRQKLFQVTNSDEYKVFYPGDKFIITSSTITNEANLPILKAIIDGVIKLHLGVITSSGAIEYLDESKLRTYPITVDNTTLNTWIYPISSSVTVSSILSDYSKVQVFSGKSSGCLILIAELNTIDSFDLTRSYSQNGDTISVLFNGIFKSSIPNFNGKTSDNSDYRKLYSVKNLKSPYIDNTITLSGTTTSEPYEIYPACSYGVLDRMKKTGIIDFSEIRPNSEKFSEWRYFVNTESGYLKLSWGYDYYNMSEEDSITKMEFLFYDLANIQSDFLTATTEEQDKALSNIDLRYEVTREYYNGNFEEIIPFNSSSSNGAIYMNKIYVVVVRRKIKDTWTNAAYKLIYTGTLFNTNYESISQYNEQSKPVINITITPSVTNKITKDSTYYKSKLFDSTDFGTYSTDVSKSDFIKEVDTTFDDSKYSYTTKVKRLYNLNSTITLDTDWNSTKYVGSIKESSIDSKFINLTGGISNFNHDNASYSTDDSLSDIIKADTFESDGSISFSNLAGTGKLSTTREIYATSGGIQTIASSVERLLPIYRNNISDTLRKSLFNYNSEGSTLYCCAGDKDYISYNSKIKVDVAHTQGEDKGVKGAGGADDVGLQSAMLSMGDGIIGLLAGQDKDAASYKFKNIRHEQGSSDSLWNPSKNEVDIEDNFLLVVWKNEEGKYSVINFGSRKTDTIDPTTTSSDHSIIRVDRMLNCILSQILTVQKIDTSAYFVGPNKEEYVYHLPFSDTCTLTITNPNTGTYTLDIYYDNTNTIDYYVSEWKKICPSLVDYLPTFTTNISNTFSTSIEFGSDIKLDDSKNNILNYYLTAYSNGVVSKVLPDGIDRSKLYIVDPTTCTGHNSDGSLVFSPTSKGNYVNLSSATSLALWDYDTSKKTSALPRDLNDMFTTSYKSLGMVGEISDSSFFNGMLLKKEYSPNQSDSSYYNYFVSGKWTSKKDVNAPDLCYKVTFWIDPCSTNNKTLYRYPYYYSDSK